MRGKPHSDETKAAVVAALLAGSGITEVATQHGLDPSVVCRWRQALPPEQLQVVASQKRADFGALVETYLVETLTTLTAQARTFRDEGWLKKQAADDLAVLHGVCADKAIRLLEAAERAYAAGYLPVQDGDGPAVP